MTPLRFYFHMGLSAALSLSALFTVSTTNALSEYITAPDRIVETVENSYLSTYIVDSSIVPIYVAEVNNTITVNSTADNLTTGDGMCTLREAIKAANTNAVVDACSAGSGADTIILSTGTYVLSIAGTGEDANATGDLDATDSAGLTIIGTSLASTIIDANGIDRAIHAVAGPLTLTNLTIQNGNATGNGGGVLTANRLSLTSTLFITNTASNFGGGAHVVGAATFTNAQFINNAGNVGGGLSNFGAATVSGGVFERNRARTDQGGGMWVSQALHMTGTLFLTNTAVNDGGGLYANSTTFITNTTFISNTGSRGGGVRIEGVGTVIGGVFERNRTTSGSGGGLYALGALNLSGTQFITNTSGGTGGGLHAQSTSVITNATFISNTAQSSGGGAYFAVVATVISGTFERNLVSKLVKGGGLYVVGTLNLSGTQFLTNTAGFGGGIFANNTAIITNVTFINNKAIYDGDSIPSGPPGDGGGAYIAMAATVNNSIFERNDALGKGGGLIARNISNLTGTQFIANTATNEGGGVFADSFASITNTIFISNMAASGGGLYANATLNLTGTQFLTNTAGSNGGGLYAVSNTVITNSQFISNVAADGHGGGGYLNSMGTLNDNRFDHNSAFENGGGIYVGSAATISTTIFSLNVAFNGGGAFINNALSITGTQFLTNTAFDTGGGVYATGNVTVTNATFVSNTATYNNGGGAYFNNSATVTGGRFERNSANLINDPFNYGHGGGLFVGMSLTLTSTQFLTNTAYLKGGGVYVSRPASISTALFSGNIAGDGGGAFINNALSVTGTQFLTNTAFGNGGGVAVQGNATITNTTFTNNTALFYVGGGAFLNALGSVTGTQFLANRAGDAGGGVAAMSTAFITNSTFTSNTVQNTGGGAYFDGAAVVNGSIFALNNTTGNAWAQSWGGGLFSKGSLALTGTQFLTNTANNSGGGLYAASTAAITNSQFISNVAANGNGGGGYLNSTGTLSGSSFDRNSASANGGGVLAFGLLNLKNSQFMTNTAGLNGGGLYVTHTAAISNTAFVNNRAGGGGGGGYFAGPNAQQLVNVLFARNQAIGSGSAIFKGDDSRFDLIHATIVSTSVVTGAGVQAVYVANGVVNITNTIIASHTVGIEQAGGSVSENYNLFDTVSTPYSGTITKGGFTITDTALFFDSTSYTLTANSAAVDAGVNAGLGNDYFGGVRPLGNGFDMGYNESPFSASSDLGVVTTASPNPVVAGAMLTYTFHISNSGRLIAPNVIFTAALPAGVVFVSGSVITPGGSGSCVSLIIGCNLGTFLPGNFATVTLTTTAPSAAGNIVNSAGVTASNDSLVNNNISEITTLVTNLAPIANAGTDQNVSVGSLITLTGVASNDADGHLPLAYLWAQTGGVNVALSAVSLTTTTFMAPNVPSVLTFTLIVTDAMGLAANIAATVVITVNDIAITSLAAQNSSPNYLGAVTFFTATIGAGTNAVYSWNFGDGQLGSGAAVNHTYAVAGNYTSIITATNAAGEVSTTTLVQVLPSRPILNRAFIPNTRRNVASGW